METSKECKYFAEDDITSAYFKSLQKVARDGYVFGLTTEVRKPVIDTDASVDDSLHLVGLNLDTVRHEKYKKFNFDGKSGAWWIGNRIDELFTGLYHRAIANNNQLGFVQNALKQIKTGRYTWCTNRLLCITFDAKESHFSHLHLARQPIPPCLTTLDFKRERNQLHLISSWRAQYFDTKAYGNLLSLAMLLREVCENTSFLPGHLISIAHKAILKNSRNAEQFIQELELEPPKIA